MNCIVLKHLNVAPVSVADPDSSDPYVFWPPGSGSRSISQRSGSGPFYHQAKIVRKPWFLLLGDFFLTLYLWKWCKCTFKKEWAEKLLKNSFLLASWRSMTKMAGSGSGYISQRHGSPDPYQNFMDPQHRQHRHRYMKSMNFFIFLAWVSLRYCNRKSTPR